MNTIQDIINALEKVEDKTKPLWFGTNDGSYCLDNTLTIEDDGTVYINENENAYN